MRFAVCSALGWVQWVVLVLCLSGTAHADESLDSALQQRPEQARQVSAIEADYRRSMARIRGEYNREMRALRRARIANDAAAIDQQAARAEALQQQMRDTRTNADAAIRRAIDTDQHVLLDRHIATRQAMQGSSRDERTLE